MLLGVFLGFINMLHNNPTHAISSDIKKPSAPSAVLQELTKLPLSDGAASASPQVKTSVDHEIDYSQVSDVPPCILDAVKTGGKIPEDKYIQSRFRFHFVDETNKLNSVPLVVMLGFNDSKPRHLKLYVNHYIEKGYDVVTFNPSTKDTYWPPTNDMAGMELWRVISKLCSKHVRPVIIHLFSGSIYPYYRMMYLFNKRIVPRNLICEKEYGGFCRERILKCLAGTVMDSTPIDPRGTIASNAIVTHFPRILSDLAYYPIALAIRGAWLFSMNHLQWRGDFWNIMDNPVNNMPILFLYSKIDKITDHKAVDALVDRLKAKKHEVFSVRWDKSPHVLHSKSHPQEYFKQTDDFVKYCVQRIQQINSRNIMKSKL